MPASPLASGANITSKPSMYGYDPIQGYSGVDYLDKTMSTFNKS